MMKVHKDAMDYENYGGNIAPRPNSVEPSGQIKGVVSEKEHKASLYDFASTQAKWINKDLTDTADFKAMSPGFQRLLTPAKV
jgi:hypothetical protein